MSTIQTGADLSAMIAAIGADARWADIATRIAAIVGTPDERNHETLLSAAYSLGESGYNMEYDLGAPVPREVDVAYALRVDFGDQYDVDLWYALAYETLDEYDAAVTSAATAAPTRRITRRPTGHTPGVQPAIDHRRASQPQFDRDRVHRPALPIEPFGRLRTQVADHSCPRSCSSSRASRSSIRATSRASNSATGSRRRA